MAGAFPVHVTNLTNSTLTLAAPMIPGQSRFVKLRPRETIVVDRDIVFQAFDTFCEYRSRGAIFFDDGEVFAGTGATGLVGSTGLEGPPGATGAIGLQGVTGDRGTTGPGGPTGGFGSKGETGAQGTQGQTGFGVAGPAGGQGATGIQGLEGNQGDTGFGLQGSTGLQGPTGLEGAGGGAQGETGLPGPTGGQGIQGSQGDTGLGPQGIQGDTGTQGIQGTQGDTGFGIQGDTGVDGPTGPAGGPPGPQGETGLTGAAGAAGATGASGTGSDGATGVQGIQGDQGDTGVAGIQGATGVGGGGGGGGSNGAYGELATSGTTTTAITAGVYTKLLGVYILGESNLFDEPVEGRLRYTGSTTDVFHVHASISAESQSANRTFSFRIAKNGTTILDTQINRAYANASDPGAMSVHGLVELDPNDYVELFADVNTGTVNLDVDNLTLTAFSSTAAQGTTGVAGIAGSVGSDGSTGPQGQTGLQGATGAGGGGGGGAPGSSTVNTFIFTLGAGASVAARIAASVTGLPSGWSVVDGTDGSVDSQLTGTGDDLVIIHDTASGDSFNGFALEARMIELATSGPPALLGYVRIEYGSSTVVKSNTAKTQTKLSNLVSLTSSSKSVVIRLVLTA